MLSVTSFKSYHVYTLDKPIGPVKFVLVITDDEFLLRPHQQALSVLFLLNRKRNVESEIRVEIRCRDSGGTASVPMDYWVYIDNVYTLEKEKLIITSATPISANEEDEIQIKLKGWFGL